MYREEMLDNYYMVKEASERSSWWTRPRASDSEIEQMDRRARRITPFLTGGLGAGLGGLSMSGVLNVTGGPKPLSGLGLLLGGAAGYGVGRLLSGPVDPYATKVREPRGSSFY